MSGLLGLGLFFCCPPAMFQKEWSQRNEGPSFLFHVERHRGVRKTLLDVFIHAFSCFCFFLVSERKTRKTKQKSGNGFPCRLTRRYTFLVSHSLSILCVCTRAHFGKWRCREWGKQSRNRVTLRVPDEQSIPIPIAIP